jgi:hypothetical protein
MGIIPSVCGNYEHELQIKDLQSKLSQQKKLTSKALEVVSSQKLNIRNHILQANQYEKKIEQYHVRSKQYEKEIEQYHVRSTKFSKYESTFQDSNILASHILSTELNCQWMSDKNEKEYLISIFDYIIVSISDPSFCLIQQYNCSTDTRLQ